MDWTTPKGWTEGLTALMQKADGKTARLAELEFFDGCSRKALATAARLVDFIHVEPATVLAREGRLAGQVLIVSSGKVTVERSGGEVEIAGKGTLFGEMAALGHLPYPETVAAQGYAEVAVIGAREFRHLLDSAPCLALKVLERITRQQRVA